MTKRISTAMLMAASGLALLSPSALASAGYQGEDSNGCQAYVDGNNAWTDCDPASTDGQLATKAVCTSGEEKESAWSFVGAGSRVTRVALVTCDSGVLNAETIRL
ncbi:hypothetical protein [Corynebacterium lowii]|uniref:hypothetical protein n=1 Tax=Corynebacterium lowii TaxID=1544413 RepID=UPI0012E19528|nr:hypothetical protein [Corynebacterium lowii]MDP9852171.1 hypothetical protein [Corynebacterium lowii]